MQFVHQLISFGLRQVIGDGIENVVEAIQQRFRDHSQTLPKALGRAHDRAWQASAIALAGDGFIDRVKVFFASGDDKGIRQQVTAFLEGNVAYSETPDEVRRLCLVELKRLRKSGLLGSQEFPQAEIARHAAGFRHSGLIEGATLAVAQVAAALAEGYPNLSRLLTPPPTGPPLLAAAFAFFLRREVETDEELAHGLFFDGLRQLSASQTKSFVEVRKVLETLGDQIDQVILGLEQIGEVADKARVAAGRAEEAAQATHEAVLSMRVELRKLANGREEVRQLIEDTIKQERPACRA
jgi:hypothetical protein